MDKPRCREIAAYLSQADIQYYLYEEAADYFGCFFSGVVAGLAAPEPGQVKRKFGFERVVGVQFAFEGDVAVEIQVEALREIRSLRATRPAIIVFIFKTKCGGLFSGLKSFEFKIKVANEIIPAGCGIQ